MKYFTFILTVFSLFKLSAQITFEEREIANGIHHKKIINSQDTLVINILQIDLSNDDYFLQAIKAEYLLNAKETTTGMVQAYNDSGYSVIAAINADFFEEDGEIINNMISEGNFVKAVKFTDSGFNPFVNTQFAVTFDNKLLMDQFVFTGNVFFPDGSSEEISRINSRADSNSISLYNYYQGRFTPELPDSWIVNEYVLKSIGSSGDTLKYIIDDMSKSGKTEINKNEIILSSNNRYAYYLERDLNKSDTVKLLLKFSSDYNRIQSLVGGWPRIVTDGKNIIKNNKEAEGIFPGFSETRHPRTGIGFSKDSSKVYFVAVDGRQRISRGMSLEEFADLMISEGVYQGLNLDGGGSTTMVINNKLVNNPSDSNGERMVGNCLMLISRIIKE